MVTAKDMTKSHDAPEITAHFNRVIGTLSQVCAFLRRNGASPGDTQVIVHGHAAAVFTDDMHYFAFAEHESTVREWAEDLVGCELPDLREVKDTH